MQVNVELRNLRADDLDDLRQTIDEGGDVEIRVRATAVDLDSFGRDATVRCEDASVTLLDRDRGVHRWRGGDPLDEPRTQRRLRRYDDRDWTRSVSPRRRPDELPGPDPIRLPAPVMPAWAQEISPDNLPRLPQGLGWQRIDDEGRSAFRFGQQGDGRGR